MSTTEPYEFTTTRWIPDTTRRRAALAAVIIRPRSRWHMLPGSSGTRVPKAYVPPTRNYLFRPMPLFDMIA
eukprot:6191913-Pleurochrysis_carterae.AAC.1